MPTRLVVDEERGEGLHTIGDGGGKTTKGARILEG